MRHKHAREVVLTGELAHLASWLRFTQKPDKETSQVRWVIPAEANDLIAQTKNAVGRKRDLDVLRAAIKLHATLQGRG